MRKTKLLIILSTLTLIFTACSSASSDSTVTIIDTQTTEEIATTEVTTVEETTIEEPLGKKTEILESSATETELQTFRPPLSLRHGKLLDFKDNNELLGENMAIIKAKITSSSSNKTTISQNYFNVENFILKDKGDTFDEIQYWAVMDGSDGSEVKVISFTVGRDVIDQIVSGRFPSNIMGDHATDLWIHPSLLQ